MSISSVSSHIGAPLCGQVALVTYLPDPLASFLTQVRQSLGGENIPEAHITFLPPRPLRVPVEEAADEIRHVLLDVDTFEVELGTVKLFPTTNILYIDVVAGQRELFNLHEALNIGTLFADEQYEFVPHLTLSGALVSHSIAAAQAMVDNAWNQCGLSSRFLVSELVLLRQSSGEHWTRVSSFRLKPQTGTATQT